jgi:hypothetical protein
MRTAIFLAAAVVICGMLDVSAANRVYRWIDKEGHVHYTDQPPADIPSTAIAPGLPTIGTSETPAAPATATKTASTEAKPEDCGKAKEKLAAYNAASKITETDALGNTREYTAEDRLKLIEVMKTKVDQSCGAATP